MQTSLNSFINSPTLHLTINYIRITARSVDRFLDRFRINVGSPRGNDRLPKFTLVSALCAPLCNAYTGRTRNARQPVYTGAVCGVLITAPSRGWMTNTFGNSITPKGHRARDLISASCIHSASGRSRCRRGRRCTARRFWTQLTDGMQQHAARCARQIARR